MTYPINTVYSRGATNVREAISSYLEEMVPVLLAKSREQWHLDEYLLPVPVEYRAYEPTGLDRWPLIGTAVARTKDWGRVDLDGAGAYQYRPRYEVQLFLWVRTPQLREGNFAEPEYKECLRLRDDLAAVVRHALLIDPSMNDDQVELHEDTLDERYSEATQVNGGRWIAGCTWSFDLSYDEGTVDQGIIGVVNDVHVIGKHQQESMRSSDD